MSLSIVLIGVTKLISMTLVAAGKTYEAAMSLARDLKVRQSSHTGIEVL